MPKITCVSVTGLVISVSMVPLSYSLLSRPIVSSGTARTISTAMASKRGLSEASPPIRRFRKNQPAVSSRKPAPITYAMGEYR